MKIGIIAPPFLPIPPKKYGGTERIVSLLTEELVNRSHSVTLFATGDSKTKAELRYILDEHIGNSGFLKSESLYPLQHIEFAYSHAEEFDIIHNHSQYLGLFHAPYIKTPVVHTWHGSMYKEETTEEKRSTLKRYGNQNFISISDNQRQGIPQLNFISTVYNAIELDDYNPINDPKRDYLLWVGRIAKKKGPLDAIMAAKRTGYKLILSATIDPIEEAYFNEFIKPHVDQNQIFFSGEQSRESLAVLYQNAICTLYPISWNEPFGLVMGESMACGTPVIAYDIGSVSEIIEDGITGYIIPTVESSKERIIKQTGIDGLVEGIKNINSLDRDRCVNMVRERFSTKKMVDGYEKAYSLLLSR